MKDYLNIKDNPNPAANIGFMCYVPLHFYIYKNIYKYLKNSEYIIGDLYDAEDYNLTSNYLENLLEFFNNKKEVYWRFINFNEYKSNPDEFYNKYALLVSTWYHGTAMSALYNKDKKLVRVLYSNVKAPWNFGLWNSFFDLVLSHGDYSQKFLTTYGNSIITGNARFDDWFLNNVDEKELNNIKKNLNTYKKTILYLPTHGELSSLPFLVEALNSISLKYNVILKFHHDTYLYEKELVNIYQENPRIILKSDKDDILPLLKVADFVISDNSGAIFDAVLADKPVILINFLDRIFFDDFKESLYYIRNGRLLGAVTSENSLEQIIKQPDEEIGPVIQISCKNYLLKERFKQQVQEKEVIKAISLALEKEKKFKLARKKIRNFVFSYNDGKCGKRAADKILELLKNPKPSPTFIAEATIRYCDYLRMTIEKKINNPTREAAEKYLRIKSLSFWKKIKIIMDEFFYKT